MNCLCLDYCCVVFDIDELFCGESYVDDLVKWLVFEKVYVIVL